MLYAIVEESGEIISKWVERYDLDSDHEIVDGEVIRPEEKGGSTGTTTCPMPPEIIQSFCSKLLSTPIIPLLFKK